MRALVAAVLGLFVVTANAQEPVRLFAAGSLRGVMTELMQASGLPAQGTFGPSGLLRERIEKGEGADVFASADMGHPQKLASDGRAGPVTLFTRNRLCALASPKAGVTSENLLEKMLDPAVKLATSTPKADPSGDYAWLLFDKAERLRGGATAALQGKALKLSGGPNSAPPPQGRNVYGYLVEKGDADVYLAYCTAAIEARAQVPSLQIVQVPEALAVGADYGLTVVKGARADAQKLADFILSAPGQALLKKHGFSPRE
jgi:ABC-type molybdate transport system substrate-binding protein